MSISIDSYESIVNLVCQYYDRNLPVYFTDAHYNITCDVIARLLQKPEFSIVRTRIKLYEPIIENGGVIYISLPLLGMLVNLPVNLPTNNVQFVDNFDIFHGLIPMDPQQTRNQCYRRAHRPSMSDDSTFSPSILLKPSSSSSAAALHKTKKSKSIKFKRPKKRFGEFDINYMPEQQYQLVMNARKNIERKNNNDIFGQMSGNEVIRFTQLLRIILACTHFYQHYSENIPYNDHTNFKQLEIADA